VNEQGHRQAYSELRASRSRLDPVVDIRAYVELSQGLAIHLVGVGAWRHRGVDLDQHQGMARWLRQEGFASEATALATIETIRTGRWYGRQGNGNAAAELDKLLAQLETWALA
jgi:hypothetical protein